MNLAELLKDSAYKLTQFTPVQIATLEAGITVKVTEKASAPYCLAAAFVSQENRHRAGQ